METRDWLSVSARCRHATDWMIRCWLRAHKCLQPHSVSVTTNGEKKMSRFAPQPGRRSAVLLIETCPLTRRFGTRICCPSRVKAVKHSGYAKQEFPSTTKSGTQTVSPFIANTAKRSGLRIQEFPSPTRV